jgi:hypothetical protein
MSTPEESPRGAFRLSLRGGPVVPLVGVCVGVVALTAAVTLGGQDSSSSTSAPGNTPSSTSADDRPHLPTPNTCLLRVGDTDHALSVVDARTLTQVAAVGWQVKAPTEMIARVLDLATVTPGSSPTTTQALDLFTREDTAAPTAGSLAEIRALTDPGALTCVFGSPAATAEAKGKTGLTPRADAMRQGVVDAFGKLTMSGYGGKAKTENSAEAAGRAFDVAVPVTSSPEASAGWVLAHWLAARGADYKLDTIAYGDRVWAPNSGWQTAAPGHPLATPARPGRVYVAVTQGTAGSNATKKSKRSTRKSGSR